MAPSRGLGQVAQLALSVTFRVGGALVLAASVLGVFALFFPPLRGLLDVLPAFGALGRVAGGAIVALVAVALVGNLFAAPTVRLGLDGLVLRSLGRRRFVSYRDVRAVDRGTQGIVLELADGRTMLLPMRPVWASLQGPFLTLMMFGLTGTVARDVDEVRAVAELLRQTIAERVSSAQVPVDGQVVLVITAERQGAPASLSSGRYRVPSIGPEAVGELLESPAATVEQRLDAARALIATGDPALRRRVQRTREQCADPSVGRELARIEDADGVDDDADADPRGADPERRRARV
jgi:hypothetical protein